MNIDQEFRAIGVAKMTEIIQAYPALITKLKPEEVSDYLVKNAEIISEYIKKGTKPDLSQQSKA